MRARSLFPILLASLLCSAALAKTYKWVDEQGVTHYGDTIPPQYKDRTTYELNKRGVVIKKTDPTLTSEQRRAKEEDLARQAAEEQKIIEQRRKDIALMNTYSSEKEIELKRDRDLKVVEALLANAQSSLKTIQAQLDEYGKAADAARGKAAPPHLASDIAAAEAEKQRIDSYIAGKRQEMEAIRAKYGGYKKRFAEARKGNCCASER